VKSEMHLEAGIKQVRRCTCRPIWSELRDSIGGHVRRTFEMEVQDVPECVRRFA